MALMELVFQWWWSRWGDRWETDRYRIGQIVVKWVLLLGLP